MFRNLGVTLVACALIASGCAPAARPAAADETVKRTAETMLRSLGTDWSVAKLESYADPRFFSEGTRPQIEKLFASFRTKLGPLRTLGLRQSAEAATTRLGGSTNAASLEYDATFQKASGRISLTLVEDGDAWRILGLHVTSNAFLQ